MRSPDDLIIPAWVGVPINHYRVRQGQVQFRSIDRDASGSWRTLSQEDVLMHLILKTPVADWLYARRGLILENMANQAA